MKLLEYEGKRLLRRHAVETPQGALWPTLPSQESPSGWMVKAQVLQGHRARHGGIRFAPSLEQAGQIARTMDGAELAGETVSSVYLEQKIPCILEMYVAALVDRDKGCVRVVATRQGGSDIETLDPDLVMSLLVDPLVGFRPYQSHLLAVRLGLEGNVAVNFQDLILKVYTALTVEDAELVEINPLLLLPDDTFVAADAKITLDDDAVGRHPVRSLPMQWRTDGDFMQRTRELGAIGIDCRDAHRDQSAAVDPEGIAILANGAGVTMATFDLVSALGGSVSGAIELHGALTLGVQHTTQVVSALGLLRPRVVLINGFYQLRPCDAFAQAIVEAVLRGPLWIEPQHVVVRMRGLNEAHAREIVDGAGFLATRSLEEAALMAVKLASPDPDAGH
ncbi:MAG: ATP-grasp domain-containing protein [Candidatus Dormiibacterota bacterium]